MSPHLTVLRPDQLVSELFEKARVSRFGITLGLGLALAAHALAGGLALTRHQEVERLPPPVELELAPPEPVRAPEPPAPVAREEPTQPRVAAAEASPPAAARAGALLTAKDDPKAQAQPEGPVDFTNDPTAMGFGGGVVAVGGKAAFGEKGARVAERQPVAVASAAVPRESGETLTPLADLGRKPSLPEADPCRGYFPSAASDDVATASVLVVVGKSGAVSKVSVVSETPRAQGFGAAARSCMLRKRFSPALDRQGRPVATAVRVNVRFSR